MYSAVYSSLKEKMAWPLGFVQHASILSMEYKLFSLASHFANIQAVVARKVVKITVTDEINNNKLLVKFQRIVKIAFRKQKLHFSAQEIAIKTQELEETHVVLKSKFMNTNRNKIMQHGVWITSAVNDLNLSGHLWEKK